MTNSWNHSKHGELEFCNFTNIKHKKVWELAKTWGNASFQYEEDKDHVNFWHHNCLPNLSTIFLNFVDKCYLFLNFLDSVFISRRLVFFTFFCEHKSNRGNHQASNWLNKVRVLRSASFGQDSSDDAACNTANPWDYLGKREKLLWPILRISSSLNNNDRICHYLIEGHRGWIYCQQDGYR